MIIKGWVNPKYLDEDWYSSLSFNLNKKMVTEVPAVLSVNTKSYLGAKLTSSILSYGDLEDKVSLQKQFIKKLEQKNKILMEALEFYANHNHIREYGNGQQIILEPEECIDTSGDEKTFNCAEKAIKKAKELDDE